MPQQSFSAKVSDWVAKTKVRTKAVRNQSVQDVVRIMQTPVAQGGNMPVDTGFLRSSGLAGLNGVVPPLVGHPGGDAYGWDEGQINLVLANAKLEDTITFAYGANYAVYQEYGTMHFEGRRFVALAAQQWPQIVEKNCAQAETRFG